MGQEHAKHNGGGMPLNKRIVFTLIGVLLMATTMATFNKYLVYGAFSVNLFKQVGIAFCQKAPVAFILQFFFVQKWVAKQVAKHPTDNDIVYRAIRVGYTVLVMCPIMCLYSNIINMISFHWTFAQLIEAWITKMPINWIFAYCIQVWILNPLNRKIMTWFFH
jgi:hypothetical protein